VFIVEVVLIEGEVKLRRRKQHRYEQTIVINKTLVVNKNFL
jgi:hypothetical protein